MISKPHSWWQKAKKPLEIFVILVVSILVIILLVVIALTYIFNVNVPGLSGKTLWDWLQLLIIPAVLAVGGYAFTYTTSRNDREATERRTKAERKAAEKSAQAERDIALDNQKEAILQVYIDQMSELLLHEKLRESQPEGEVHKIARVRTLSVLSRLDSIRKANVLQFLFEAGLIDEDKRIIDLSGADLRGAFLTVASLRGANLSEANLSEAKLIRADLTKANLRGADLSHTNLYRANLSEANLSEAYLSRAYMENTNMKNANITQEQLEEAQSLKGAIMRDGSIHP